MPKVSIIIPAYNVKKYIERCLESAINQTLKDIEIICVNDGSTDGTEFVIEKYAVRDSRICLINKPNTGYGDTMNVGIDRAKSKYIVFLESDDFILPTMCERMYKICELYSLEVLKCDYFKFTETNGIIHKEYMNSSEYDNYGRVFSIMEHPRAFFASMHTWTCMYNLDYINTHKIRHNKTPGASFQDNGFWFQTLMKCQHFYLLNEAFYMYRQDNPDSSIHSKNKVNEFSEEYRFIRNKIKELPDKDKEDKKILMSICAFFNIHHNLNNLHISAKECIPDLLLHIKKDLEIYGQEEYFDVGCMDSVWARRALACILQPKRVMELALQYQEDRNRLKKYKTYILYGAGVYAKRMFSYLRDDCAFWGSKIRCGVSDLRCGVSNLSNERYVEKIEVEDIFDIVREESEALIIICAKLGTDNYNQMKKNLEKKKWNNYVDAQRYLQEKDIWEYYFFERFTL